MASSALTDINRSLGIYQGFLELSKPNFLTASQDHQLATRGLQRL